MAKAPEISLVHMVNQIPVTIRTMSPNDRAEEQRFVSSLSPRSSYLRFHGAMRELPPALLERFVNVNYPEEMALVATVPFGEGQRQIGVARFARLRESNAAEMAVVVADEWQGKGIGSQLMIALRDCAAEAGISKVYASVLTENRRMLKLCQHLGFATEPRKDDYRTVELGKEIPGKKDPK